MDIHSLWEMLLKFIDFRSFFLFLLVFFPLEHFLPIHKKKSLLREGWFTDIQHFIISGIFIRLGMIFVILVSIRIGSNSLPASVQPAVSSLSTWIQCMVIVIITDFGFYVSHRLMHSVPFLWKFHAIHHSSTQMDWLAAFRVHPVDQVIVKGTSLMPIFILGFSDAAIAITSVIYLWQSLTIHSNFRVKLGVLKWLVATPEFHHWHHSNQPETYNKNFSGQLLLWDILFRTAYLPGVMPLKYGIDDLVPKGYLEQMIYPFRLIGAYVLAKIFKKSTSV